ncbi:hypothetical protein XM74_c11745 [Vibrio vulnificus]|nr:hypothetical protein XM74_c11745 [Vibrio vulnificus]
MISSLLNKLLLMRSEHALWPPFDADFTHCSFLVTG